MWHALLNKHLKWLVAYVSTPYFEAPFDIEVLVAFKSLVVAGASIVVGSSPLPTSIPQVISSGESEEPLCSCK